MTESLFTESDYHTVAEMIDKGDWHELCAFHRDYLRVVCPRYDRREVEEIVGSWVSRIIICKRQIAERGGKGRQIAWTEEGSAVKEGDCWYLTPEAEIWHEIEAHWPALVETYRRHCEMIDAAPAAEVRVDEVLARLRRVAAGNSSLR